MKDIQLDQRISASFMLARSRMATAQECKIPFRKAYERYLDEKGKLLSCEKNPIFKKSINMLD